ncbi:maleylpyruvate isomerase family mycothiol-dependent enzyme [Gordonia desulfuricans]|uniref:Maleylpyruvate isomerase family mycothiol-dependent enzyme n=1 Tax=Gordonia desulfuricans TaxID=89051 RepID=A0A7K3LK99_9ACTN|nr:maleylpyruvate isomerase family mycothiol-dependent enzyme [Gordonia desulfuricans]NDK88689.1 maleylpyruvate isomerase family mycothiol-dependent enzyme [Gordonia desulfuricans]
MPTSTASSRPARSDPVPALIDLSAADRHRVIAAGFGTVADAVDDWDRPAPVDGWAARDVVAHLVGWMTGFLAAGGVEVPAAPALDDPPAAWRAHTEHIQALLDEPIAQSVFSHPMVGDLRLADAIDRFYTSDVFMHTWDLATAAGRPADLDMAFAAHLLDGMRPIDEVLRSSGQYGPAVPVADDADPVTALVGFIGRDPSWRGPGGPAA